MAEKLDPTYDDAAKALVDAFFGKEESKEIQPLPQAEWPGEAWNKPNNVPATLPTDIKRNWEISQDRDGFRFEVEILGNLIAFVIPLSIFSETGATVNEIADSELLVKLGMEVITNGTINLAALQRRLSPEPCTSCQDLGWKTQKMGYGETQTMKWVECPYCNNHYDKPQPSLGAM